MQWWICWITHTEDLFKVVKACVGPATLFGNVDSRESVQRFATETLNNTPQACICDKGARMIGGIYIPP